MDLLHRKDETTRPPAPVRHERRLDRRPQIPRPPAPRISRWIQWMAAFVVLAVAIVLASVYLIGDGGSTVAAYDRAAEHGQFTSFVYRDLTGVDFDTRLAGLDANLDPDIRIVPEHGAFTPLVVRDLSGVDLNRLAGLDANFDRDVILGAGYHTLMPANWGDVDIGVRFAGLDTGASVVVQVEPDALDRFYGNNPPTVPQPDALDRYLTNI